MAPASNGSSSIDGRGFPPRFNHGGSVFTSRGGRGGVTEVGGRVGRGGMLCLVQQVAAQLVQLRPAFTQGQRCEDSHFDFLLHLQHGFEGFWLALRVTFCGSYGACAEAI